MKYEIGVFEDLTGEVNYDLMDHLHKTWKD